MYKLNKLKFYPLFNLHVGEADKNSVLSNVRQNISFTGSNLWILICAIIVASVGLNVNSTAVIIGAMLISPLMGPIIGAGFSLGVFDFDLLKKSLLNLLIATITGLVVSTIYFYLSPFKETQSELLSRTSPNIYDVLIAFFGGLVGVIAITRVEKGNPIPGVAIATALMPPLCTAGYSLATGQFTFFFGSLFLYFINCVFICISTYFVVKLLKYPPVHQININLEKKLKYIMSGIIIIIIIPSIYFAYSLYNKQNFKQNVNTFIKNEFENKGIILIYKKSTYTFDTSSIELAFFQKNFTTKEIEYYQKRLANYNLKKTNLAIIQTTDSSLQKMKDDIINEVNHKTDLIFSKQKFIEDDTNAVHKLNYDYKQLTAELHSLEPSIYSFSLDSYLFYNDSNATEKVVFAYYSKKKLNNTDKFKLKNWLKARLSIKNELELVSIDK